MVPYVLQSAMLPKHDIAGRAGRLTETADTSPLTVEQSRSRKRGVLAATCDTEFWSPPHFVAACHPSHGA